MCEDTPRTEWDGLGVIQWKGELYILEACPSCGEYQAAELNVDEIPIVPARPGQQSGSDLSPGSDLGPPDLVGADEAESESAPVSSADNPQGSDAETTDPDRDESGDGWLVE